jgi:hypothetical protein
MEGRGKEAVLRKEACRAIASATAGEGAKFKDIKKKHIHPEAHEEHKESLNKY